MVGIISLIVGILVSAGWLFHFTILKSIFANWIPMKFNSAICFIICGINFLILSSKIKNTNKQIINSINAVLILLISILSLSEYILNINIGIDELFIKENSSLVSHYHPGRMLFLTAINFIAIAFGFFLKREVVIRTILASIIFITTLFEIIGYAFNISGFNPNTFIEQEYWLMPFNTSLTMMLISIGLLYLTPERGIAKIMSGSYSGSIVTRKILPLIITVPIAIGYLRILGQGLELYSFNNGVNFLITTTIILLIISIFYYADYLNKIDELKTKNDQFLQSILENSTNLIWIKDITGKYIVINKKYETSFNFINKNVIGKTDFDIFPAVYAQKFRENDLKVQNTKLATLVEESLNFNGKLHTFLSNKFPLLNKQAEVYAIAGIAVDITNRKHLEEERSRLATIVDSSTDAIYSKTLGGLITSWNPAAETLFGYTANEAIGKPISIIIPAHLRDELITIMETIRQGQNISLETLRKNKQGKLIPVAITISSIKNLNGEVVGAAAIVRDISWQKKQEQDLAIVNERLAAIMVGSKHSIISTDLAGKIQLFNPAAEIMLGYKANEVINIKTPDIFYDHQELKERAKVLSKSLHKVVSANFNYFINDIGYENVDEQEWTLIRKNGKRFPAIVSIAALQDGKGNPIGYLFMAQDISERKRIEKLQNEFVSVVSHELRTPMTSIQGALDLLTTGACGDLNSDAMELLTVALSNSERLIRLLNDILDIQKIAYGKMEINLKIIEINHLVQKAINENLFYAKKFGVEVEFKAYPENIFVNVDQDKLLQVLTNLLSNAIKFSPPQKSIYVETIVRYKIVRVTVKDQGPGIAPEFRPYIFQKFSQADASNSRAKGGTGLGLNICKSIIEKFKGQINFITEVNKGTTFYFDLPIVDTKEEKNEG